MSFPVLERAGGSLPGTMVPWVYAAGYWTGRDGDLLSVLPDVQEDNEAQFVLLASPFCLSRPLAVLAFIAKRFLVAVDQNIRAICGYVD